MKTHLSWGGVCVRRQWSGQASADANFGGFGRLVNPKGNYDGCEYVPIYHSPTAGYGYRTAA